MRRRAHGSHLLDDLAPAIVPGTVRAQEITPEDTEVTHPGCYV
ncbi:hypothetical protein STRTUCAR8_00362 [Streptomyces turgidiscabies Car8]|uniref:Uncharacterized protein n=1 Tax=Streptomyces turgidiscabies (strain Car8) TaxID=698760 RepID=L7FF05_STRT8|nr:hypothetical protein STRTUCAR8_00362 [Streptomyces turgidiscabies Car8]